MDIRREKKEDLGSGQGIKGLVAGESSVPRRCLVQLGQRDVKFAVFHRPETLRVLCPSPKVVLCARLR